MTIVFHARLYGKFIEIQSNLRRKKFLEQITAPIFLTTVLVIEIMQESQSNLEEKDKPQHLKRWAIKKTSYLT